jgi:hypothetical protein
MPVRYAAHGPMVHSTTGTYVAVAEYEALDAALKAVASTAHACFTQIELGELTASDAKAALFSAATLAGYALTQ